MAIEIINIMKKYDSITNSNLSDAFIRNVFKEKNITLTAYILDLFNNKIPQWLQEKKNHREAVYQLYNDLKNIVFILR